MIKVKATDMYKKLNKHDNELGRMPEEGEEWEVTEDRYKVLSGENRYKAVFVKKVRKPKKKEETE